MLDYRDLEGSYSIVLELLQVTRTIAPGNGGSRSGQVLGRSRCLESAWRGSGQGSLGSKRYERKCLEDQGTLRVEGWPRVA